MSRFLRLPDDPRKTVFEKFLDQSRWDYGEELTLELPLVRVGPPKSWEGRPVPLSTSEIRRAYVRVAKIQQECWRFARSFLSKKIPNPDPLDAKQFPEIADGSRTVRDIYLVMRNREIQAWNAFAKLAGWPTLLPFVRRGRNRLIIDYGPDPIDRIVKVLPQGGPIGPNRESRRAAREVVYDIEAFVPPPEQHPFGAHASFPKPPPMPVGGTGGYREPLYDRENLRRVQKRG